MEFGDMAKAFEIVDRAEDTKRAILACMMTNVHIAKETDHIKPSDIVDAFHGSASNPTLELEQFKEQWREQGGELP